MDICYYRDPKFNFGDDLNAVVWPQVLSPRLLDHPDLVLVGIGSILTESMLGKYAGSGKTLVVLGAGTSYGQPPRDLAALQVLAVRGPYTAAVIGRQDKAVTDGAILLAGLPLPPAPRRDRVLFMPHHRSIFCDAWARVAAECGLTYVSPQQPIEKILAQFAQAELVVTEAMHGAIVADTLRIPWIPVAISPAVEEFKWRDWCASLELPFRPQRLPAGSFRDRGRFAHMARVLQGVGLAGFDNIPAQATPELLRDYLERRFSAAVGDLSWRKPALAKRVFDQALSVGNALPRRAAARALAHARRSPAYLSHDRVFASRLQRMRDAVGAAERLAER